MTWRQHRKWRCDTWLEILPPQENWRAADQRPTGRFSRDFITQSYAEFHSDDKSILYLLSRWRKDQRPTDRIRRRWSYSNLTLRSFCILFLNKYNKWFLLSRIEIRENKEIATIKKDNESSKLSSTPSKMLRDCCDRPIFPGKSELSRRNPADFRGDVKVRAVSHHARRDWKCPRLC